MKKTKLKPFEKLLTVLISGREVSVDQIDKLLGKEIYMYRLSTYIWHIKTIVNGIVKSIKDGKKIKAYQLINVDDMKSYLNRMGIQNYTPGLVEKKPSISKLAKKWEKPVSSLNDVKGNENPVLQGETIDNAMGNIVVPALD